MPALVYGLDVAGVHYRVVNEGSFRVIERREKDSLGDPRWTTVGRWNITTRDRHDTEDSVVKVLLAMLDDTVSRTQQLRDEMNKSYTYSKTPEADPIEGPD